TTSVSCSSPQDELSAAHKSITGSRFDILRFSKFAHPSSIGQLPRRVGVKKLVAEQGDFLKAWLAAGVHLAIFVSQSFEQLLQNADPVVARLNRYRPAHAWLPPVFQVSGGPRDAVVVDARRAADAMVVQRETRKCFDQGHGLRCPCLFPHSIHAWAMRRTLPAASGGTGF